MSNQFWTGDPRPKHCGIDFAKLPKPKKSSRPSKLYSQEYNRKKREKWLRLGIVKPLDMAEAAIYRKDAA